MGTPAPILSPDAGRAPLTPTSPAWPETQSDRVTRQREGAKGKGATRTAGGPAPPAPLRLPQGHQVEQKGRGRLQAGWTRNTVRDLDELAGPEPGNSGAPTDTPTPQHHYPENALVEHLLPWVCSRPGTGGSSRPLWGNPGGWLDREGPAQLPGAPTCFSVMAYRYWRSGLRTRSRRMGLPSWATTLS